MRQVAGVLLLVLLAACRAPMPRPDLASAMAQQEAREEQLESMTDWSLVGRLALSNGRDGGSGRIAWVQEGAAYDLQMQAPVSRQTWRLQVGPAGARLDGLEGGVRIDADPVGLLLRETGWLLPLADLAFWVRGVRGDGQAELTFGGDGLPQRLQQRGWIVDYRDWDRERRPPLPRKMFAQRGEQKVRLVIERWTVTAGD
jgi:outer membrane lipoprotein LolB